MHNYTRIVFCPDPLAETTEVEIKEPEEETQKDAIEESQKDAIELVENKCIQPETVKRKAGSPEKE